MKTELKLLKRKSALLTQVLVRDHWDKYAKGLISELLEGYSNLLNRKK